jgi:hypothetical protein
MKLYLGGANVTELAADVGTSGSAKECARSLKASIVQSPSDKNLPVVPISKGMPVVLSADGQYFVGIVTSATRSTTSNTIDVTAKDFGIYVKKNKISYKATKTTPEAAGADICALYGVPVGRMAATGFTFSRAYLGQKMYDAIMTGYSLAAAENGKKYQLIMEGTAVSVIERGTYVAAVIAEGKNMIEATYSESIENMINQVDIYDKDGKLLQSVQGDTSYGIMRDQITLTDKEDGVAKAEQIIRDNDVNRSASVRNLGDAGCVSGAAVFIHEPYTGLYGRFWIESDAHNWKNGVYTNALTLAFKNSMDEKSAGTALKDQKPSTLGKPIDGDTFIGINGEEVEYSK